MSADTHIYPSIKWFITRVFSQSLVCLWQSLGLAIALSIDPLAVVLTTPHIAQVLDQ
jgi:hypothetical protein